MGRGLDISMRPCLVDDGDPRQLGKPALARQTEGRAAVVLYCCSSKGSIEQDERYENQSNKASIDLNRPSIRFNVRFHFATVEDKPWESSNTSGLIPSPPPNPHRPRPG